jgi:hypothetical protein
MQAVIQALGREPTKAEFDGIEARLTRAMRNLARQDSLAWMGKSQAERLQEAGQAAAQELIAEHQVKERRAALTIAAQGRIQAHLTDQAARGITGLDALDRIVAFHADNKSHFISIETQARAIERDGLRQMLGTLEASHPKWFGLFENADGIKAIVREIFGEDSGVPEAKQGAKEWHAVAASLRERFNRAGGDVGQLEDWGMPHHHSQAKVAKVGRDQWVADTMPALDREHYFNPDGSRMNDAQLSEFLGNAWTSIATGGANKVEPGAFRGSGARANRGSESRQIHFKDADAYMAYQAKYGEKSLYEVLVGHIESVSKDTALVETLGPNPDNTYRLFRDSAVREGKLADPTKSGKLDERAVRSDNLYNVVAGKTQPVASKFLADTFDTLRNWLIAARLGSSVITSFSDDATLHLTAKVNHLPEMRLLANELATFNPANRMEERLALRAGLAMQTLISSLNRFGQQGLGRSFSSKLANTVLRASGLNAMTEARKRAFGVTMMHALGSVTKEHGSLGELDANDHRILLSKGITENDFAVWKKAQLEDWGGGNDTMLTPESIYRIPDETIDQVIAPKVAALQANAQGQINELQARDAQERQWADSRTTKLRSWVAEQQQKLAERISKTDTAGKERLMELKAKIGKLEETIDGVAGYWDANAGPDTPGIQRGQTVGFYGKRALRDLGITEGKAQEAIKNTNSLAREVTADVKRLKADLTDAFIEKWGARQADIMEFTQRAQDRISRRAQVIDRIQKDIAPAIDAERIKAREQAATKLLAHILEETDVAVIEPGAKERSFTGAGLQRGTWKGELTRSFFLFKSFPLAMITRHWARGMSLPNTGSRAAYLATLFAATTVLGVASLEVNEVLTGRDPKSMNPFDKGGVRNWISAMLKGGSLGIYGDFLFSDSTQYGNSPIATVTGPVLGLAEDVFNLTQGNIIQTLQGKPANVGAETVRFVKGNTPGASIWYAKAALDHLIWNQLSEYFSPGYLARIRSRAQTEFQQKYYWEPQDVAPSRAPDLSAAVSH